MHVMVRGFEQPPDTLATREAEMRPRVREYAHKVHAELLDLYGDLGVADMGELVARITAAPKAFIEQRGKISRVQALSETLHGILANPKDYQIPKDYELSIEDEFRDREDELREHLGNDFVVSFDAIEKAFTLKNGTRAVEISEQERQEAMQGLIEKLAEPDVAQFVKKLETDKVEAAKWMLVYRTSAKIQSHGPVSILSLRDRIDTDARTGSNPTKLIIRNSERDNWYRNDRKQGDPDAWASRPVSPGWMFVTRSVVDGTTSIPHAGQAHVLTEKAAALGFAEDKYRRRTPQEVVYDALVAYKYTDGRVRLLEGRYDWTEQEASDGEVVGVGHFDVGGMRIRRTHSRRADPSVGACLSR